MKKIISTILLTIALALTACAGDSAPADEAASAQEATAIAGVVSDTPAVAETAVPTISVAETETTSAALSTDYPNAVPVQAQLITGSLQLEDSQLAITGAQAATLLPIWAALKDLSGNSAATQEQYDELIEQVLQAMTDEQVQAIALMQVTRESMMDMMQQEGIVMGGMQPGGGAGGAPSQGTPPAGAPGGGHNGAPPQGAPPEGTPPVGTHLAGGLQTARSLSAPPGLLDAFIEFLTQKASS